MSRSGNILWLTQLISFSLQETLEQINKQNMCFIQLTPLQNLFTENLTSVNYDIFFHMLKQCFMKRHATLMDHLQ